MSRSRYEARMMIERSVCEIRGFPSMMRDRNKPLSQKSCIMDRQYEQYGLIRSQYVHVSSKYDGTHWRRMHTWVITIKRRAWRFRSPLTAHPFVDILTSI